MAGSSTNHSALVVGCIAMLLFGTLNVVMKDWQVKLGFYEPYLWNCVTFFGQSFFLPIYWMSARRPQDIEAAKTKPPAPFHAYALVTFFDFAALSLINVAYIGLPGSVLQMLKGVKLIFTVILSISVLGKSLRSHQYLGVSLTVIGVATVAYVSVTGKGTGWASESLAITSLIIGFASCLVGAMQFVWEEKTMKQYAVPPELLTGMEGVIGIVYGIIVLVVVNLIQVESTPVAFELMWHRKIILCAFLLFLAAVATFNYSALIVTQNSSAMVRSLLDVARTACIWAVEILCHWDRFTWVELAGFLVMALGTMVYGKIVKVPFLTYEEEQPLLPTKNDGSK